MLVAAISLSCGWRAVGNGRAECVRRPEGSATLFLQIDEARYPPNSVHKAHGELGNNSTTNSANPVLVSGGQSFVDLDAGDEHTCGVTTGDSLYCWGGNSDGELGLGFTSRHTTPQLVSGGLTFMVPPRE